MEINEHYKDGFRPPIGSRQTVERLLHAVPPAYLNGLGAIVLTHTAALNYARRRRKTRSRRRKVAIVEARGLYHPKWKGRSAWIELFLDQIVLGSMRRLLWLAPYRELVFAEVVYHELGHHIHATAAPLFREKENVADEWASGLRDTYFSRRYWYIDGVALLCATIAVIAIVNGVLALAQGATTAGMLVFYLLCVLLCGGGAVMSLWERRKRLLRCGAEDARMERLTNQ